MWLLISYSDIDILLIICGFINIATELVMKTIEKIFEILGTDRIFTYENLHDRHLVSKPLKIMHFFEKKVLSIVITISVILLFLSICCAFFERLRTISIYLIRVSYLLLIPTFLVLSFCAILLIIIWLNDVLRNRQEIKVAQITFKEIKHNYRTISELKQFSIAYLESASNQLNLIINRKSSRILLFFGSSLSIVPIPIIWFILTKPQESKIKLDYFMNILVSDNFLSKLFMGISALILGMFLGSIALRVRVYRYQCWDQIIQCAIKELMIAEKKSHHCLGTQKIISATNAPLIPKETKLTMKERVGILFSGKIIKKN